MVATENSNQRGLWPAVDDAFLAHHLPGKSASVHELRNAIAAFNSNFNRDLIRVITILGESGSGKNHVARVIAAHRAWLREVSSNEADVGVALKANENRFAEIAIPTIPDTLIESELFGHEKGAFTGAGKKREGLLGEAVDDILLDEIGDASEAVQAKLLRVIETGRYRPLGAALAEERDTNIRFLFATHRDLRRLVADGHFREDLYWRLSEITVTVPPLREQRENIEHILRYQLEELCRRALIDSESGEGLRPRPEPSSQDLRWAATYQWPGNIRELRHVLVRWLATGGRVGFQDIARHSNEFDSLEVQAATNLQDMHRIVYQRLSRARQNRAEAARTLGDFIEQIRRAAEQDVVRWYDDHSPSGEELERLFPRMKRSSIVTKLSQWRGRAR